MDWQNTGQIIFTSKDIWKKNKQIYVMAVRR